MGAAGRGVRLPWGTKAVMYQPKKVLVTPRSPQAGQGRCVPGGHGVLHTTQHHIFPTPWERRTPSCWGTPGGPARGGSDGQRVPGLAAGPELWLQAGVPRGLASSGSPGEMQQDRGKTNQKLAGKSFSLKWCRSN